MKISAVAGTLVLMAGLAASSTASALPILKHHSFDVPLWMNSIIEEAKHSPRHKSPFAQIGSEMQFTWLRGSRGFELPGHGSDVLHISSEDLFEHKHDVEEHPSRFDGMRDFADHLYPFCVDEVLPKDPSEVPEPGTILLFAMGLLGLGLCRRLTKR